MTKVTVTFRSGGKYGKASFSDVMHTLIEYLPRLDFDFDDDEEEYMLQYVLEAMGSASSRHIMNKYGKDKGDTQCQM